MSRQFGSIYSGTSGGSIDPSSGISNRPVSLANIATAFLSERKTSARRSSSGPRKQRLASKGQSISISKRQSSYTTTTDEILGGRRSSVDNMNDVIATLFSSHNGPTNSDNKHRSNAMSLTK
ncbi:unnamed protein product [Adineta ricciae]|uniref:Uncharacterized protein n=1 Tax=Adineta ricciae TaxID=249248 RepID=A0A814MJV2_ADIRI|nr:unnamed protein product [Adineta ricciae]CAF1079344.1 unnamed protein product [Adineta ricciae]